MATVTRKDGPAGRFYDVDGELYPSVTHVLTAINKPALVPWAAAQERAACLDAAATLDAELQGRRYPRTWYLAELESRLGRVKAHTRTLERAGDIGTQAHRYIEWMLRQLVQADAGAKPTLSPAAAVAVDTFRTWARAVDLKPILVERIVYSKRHRYAGTLDLLARVRGVIASIDFKTGKAVYGEAKLQAVAYEQALVEMGYQAPARTLIVRLPKVAGDPVTEAEPTEVTAAERAAAWPAFLATRMLWEWTYAQEQAYRRRRRTPAADVLPPLPIVREVRRA